MNNSVSIGFDDFEMLSEYINDNCKGSALNLNVNPEGNLEIKVNNMKEEEIKITLYRIYKDNTAARMPTVQVTERLSNLVKKKIL